VSPRYCRSPARRAWRKRPEPRGRAGSAVAGILSGRRMGNQSGRWCAVGSVRVKEPCVSRQVEQARQAGERRVSAVQLRHNSRFEVYVRLPRNHARSRAFAGMLVPPQRLNGCMSAQDRRSAVRQVCVRTAFVARRPPRRREGSACAAHVLQAAGARRCARRVVYGRHRRVPVPGTTGRRPVQRSAAR